MDDKGTQDPERNDLLFETAGRLAGDWARAAKQPRLSRTWLVLGPLIGHLSQSGTSDALRQFRSAIQSLEPLQISCLLSVVCLEAWASDWAAAKLFLYGSTARKRGMTVLRGSLANLCNWYRLIDARGL